ncbi:hypothetical protein E2P81_ATG05690 [Venturia nashicola]|uniref:Uncharacterized protein n=1 Tax=Venturia nashicola TaxID=86259 RepID=A0A4Z1NYJ3_9PEZI|nr:hypothetical protein E6O75_ATG05829 [Venturia nashicola]TLD29396.1 hypothetical protein E2P81_ATG05690 [Venturia nashicola]
MGGESCRGEEARRRGGEESRTRRRDIGEDIGWDIGQQRNRSRHVQRARHESMKVDRTGRGGGDGRTKVVYSEEAGSGSDQRGTEMRARLTRLLHCFTGFCGRPGDGLAALAMVYVAALAMVYVAALAMVLPRQ